MVNAPCVKRFYLYYHEPECIFNYPMMQSHGEYGSIFILGTRRFVMGEVFNAGMSMFDILMEDDNIRSLFQMAGLDVEELMTMDEDTRWETLRYAGIDPGEYF
jgi:hypothetical protein